MSNRWTMDDIKSRGLKIVEPARPVNFQIPVQSKQPASFALGRMKAGKMNKTEAAYAGYLEALKRTGDVTWYYFEPMNLKLADKCFYKVDFLDLKK